MKYPHTPPPPLDRNLELFTAKKDLVAPPKITSNRGVLKVANFTGDQAVAKYGITIANTGPHADHVVSPNCNSDI
jgi:hypothetical protein